MSKSNFIVHESTIVQIDILTDEELGRLFRIMAKYHLEGVEPDKEDRLLYSIFVEWKRIYDKDKAKYESVCRRNQANGAKSNGAPKGNTNARKIDVEETQNNPKQPKTTQNNPKQPDNDSDNEYDTDTDNESTNVDNHKEKTPKKESESDNSHGEVSDTNEYKRIQSDTKQKQPKRFVKPTIEQINSYISERGYHFDGEAFFDFYESKGWMVGSNHMKDWKAACRTWESKRKAEQQVYAHQPTVDEFPTGMDAEKWKKAQDWMKKFTPRIMSDIDPDRFLTMRAMAHRKVNIFMEILSEIDKSNYKGDIPKEFQRLAQDERYFFRIQA